MSRWTAPASEIWTGVPQPSRRQISELSAIGRAFLWRCSAHAAIYQVGNPGRRTYLRGFSGSLPVSALSLRQTDKGWVREEKMCVTSCVSARALSVRHAQP